MKADGDTLAKSFIGVSLVIVVESESYEQDTACKRELQLVALRKIPLIPIRLLKGRENREWEPKVDWLRLPLDKSLRYGVGGVF